MATVPDLERMDLTVHTFARFPVKWSDERRAWLGRVAQGSREKCYSSIDDKVAPILLLCCNGEFEAAEREALQLLRQAEPGTVVPVFRELHADLETPVSAYMKVSARFPTDHFLLESVEGGEKWARYSFIGFDPHITVDAAWGLPSQVRKANSVEEVLKAADFVTLHVPFVEATKNLVNAERLALMRSHAILLNFSRDGIVDNAAVLAALGGKKLRAYVCDFPAQALLRQAGVIAMPHLGASTREAEDNCAIMVADQLRDYLEHGNIRNAVNFPDVVMERESQYRVGIANSNVPNMLGQISTAMADAGLNIHNMLNKSKGEMAYTLVDVDSEVPAAVIDRIAAIKGVLAVRSLPLRTA